MGKIGLSEAANTIYGQIEISRKFGNNYYRT